jgi:hypothetical protein
MSQSVSPFESLSALRSLINTPVQAAVDEESITAAESPTASTQNSLSLTTSMDKKRRFCSASPTRPTSSSTPKRTKLQSQFHRQDSHLPSIKSESCPLRRTPLLCKKLSTLRLCALGTHQVSCAEAPSLKTMSMTLNTSFPSQTRLGVLTKALKARMMSPPASCPKSTSFGGPIPPHLSFVARSHQLPLAPCKTLSQSRPYPAVQSSHPLLNEELWHPNQMLPSNIAPAVNVDMEGQELAWCNLYLRFRESFCAQLSLCLISRHNLLTR